jgi:hypothetical protein
MKQDSIMNIQADDQSRQTAEIMRRFNDVFQLHDPSALAGLVSPDCVIENTGPAPDGARHVGGEACIGLWSAIAIQSDTGFDLEETFVAGERATIRWRYWMADGNSIRGVNLMRVADGLIVEAMGYIKG